MPSRQCALAKLVLHRIRQFQKAHYICDVTPGFAKDIRQLLLGMAKPIHELAKALRLLHRVQVGSLNVLDDRNL